MSETNGKPPSSFDPRETVLLKDILYHLEVLSDNKTCKSWERHALRAAWMAVDAVVRKDVRGILHAEDATRRAEHAIGLDIKDAAQIMYGYLPSRKP